MFLDHQPHDSNKDIERECRGFESHLGKLFFPFSGKGVVLGAVALVNCLCLDTSLSFAFLDYLCWVIMATSYTSEKMLVVLCLHHHPHRDISYYVYTPIEQ